MLNIHIISISTESNQTKEKLIMRIRCIFRVGLALILLLIDWNLPGHQQVDATDIDITIDSKVCHRGVEGTWVKHDGHECYCLKKSFGFGVYLVKYILVNCRLPTTTPLPSTTTMRTTTTATPTTVAPQKCPDSLRGGVPDFRSAVKFDFYATRSEEVIDWRIVNASLVIQNSNSDPTSLMLQDEFEGVDFKGSFRMTGGDDDYVGIIFSFKRNDLFYLASWKRENDLVAYLGFTLQLINSTDGLGGRSNSLRNVLNSRRNITGQAITFHVDGTPWKLHQKYTWLLTHRPRIGYMRFKIFDPKLILTVDTGDIFNSALDGGKVGVYAYSQTVEFGDFRYRCSGDVNPGLHASLSKSDQSKAGIEYFSEADFIRA